jgi:hypothetical protein
MGLDPLATLDDLATFMGASLSAEDLARADSVLGVVSAVIRSEAGEDWTTIPVPDQVRAVALAVAARAFRNPTGASYQTAGPFSANGADVGGIYLTPAEKDIIRGAVGNARGLWTQETTRGDWPATDAIVVAVDGTSEGFPMFSTDDPLAPQP